MQMRWVLTFTPTLMRRTYFGDIYGRRGVLAVRFFSDRKEEFNATRKHIKHLREEMEIQQRQEQDEQKVPELPLSKKIMNYAMNPKKLGVEAWEVLMHTMRGFWLLLLDVKISMKYLLKLALKGSLSRRERNQLFTTIADMLRVAPFSVFILVPFMEVLLPFYLRFFPQMLPSTFHGFIKEHESNKKQFGFKTKAASLLRSTLEEIAQQKKGSDTDDKSKALEFSEFLRKVREQENGYVTNADLFKFIKLFEDELTLDNLNDSQLKALCRLLGIARIGTKEFLVFRLQMKLRELKADDRLISAEGGVDVLSTKELQVANKARGMRAFGLSEEKLRVQLKQWLELSLDDQVPPSLLLLSRAMVFPEEINFTERLRSIIATLPEEIGEQTTLKLKEVEGITDSKTKIEMLRSIEQALREEKREDKKRAKAVEAAIELKAKQKEVEAKIEQEQQQQKQLETRPTKHNPVTEPEELGEKKEGFSKSEEKLDAKAEGDGKKKKMEEEAALLHESKEKNSKSLSF